MIRESVSESTTAAQLEAQAMVGDDLLASLDGGGQGRQVNEPDGFASFC